MQAPAITPARLEALLATAERPLDALPVSAILSTIMVEDLMRGIRRSYRLVQPAEADPSEGRLSIDSPVGRILCGRRPGQVVTATTPSGHRRLRVLAVEES